MKRSPIASWACSEFWLTWEQYTQMQYSKGCEYIGHEFAHDLEMIEALSASSTFWSWWRHNWERRDQRLRHELAALDSPLDRREMAELYQHTHNVVATGMHPHSIIIRTSLQEALSRPAA